MKRNKNCVHFKQFAFCADALLYWLLCKPMLLYLSLQPMVNSAKGQSTRKCKLYWCGFFYKVCQTDLHLITNVWLTPFHITSCLVLQFPEQNSFPNWKETKEGKDTLWNASIQKITQNWRLRWLTFCIAKFPIYFPLIVVKAYYKSNESQRKIILSQSYFHSYQMLLWIQKSPVEHGLFLTFAEISVCPRIYFHFSIHFRDIILKKSHRSRFFQGSWSHLQTFP